MNATTDTTIANARRAIEVHLMNSRDKHKTDVNRACHITPVQPFSVAEFVEWIKADKFKYNSHMDPKEELDYIRDVTDYINFSPEEPDYKKQKESLNKIEVDYNAVRFHNQILEPEKVMKEAEEFAKKTYH